MASTQAAAGRPWIVYGTDCSYYTGKLEAYLRAKGIAYRLEPFGESNLRRCARHTGVMQVPQVECPDGSWLVDTTLIIEYLERTRAEPMFHPVAPSAAFLSLLLEDFADEWLWRPAMHYRWSFPRNANLMAAWLSEHVAERRAPAWLKHRFWKQRQYRTFVSGDGVRPTTRAAVEAAYLDTLDALETIFTRRPYLLGERPCEADFGFFGPLFRHFCCDPVPGRVMRSRAPGVHEWVARLWNAKPERFRGTPMLDNVPTDLGDLLGLVTGVYLPYLSASSAAYARGEKRVCYQVQGVTFEEPVKPYRVWCRDRLHDRFVGLSASERAVVESALAAPAAVQDLASASPKPVENMIGTLPITAASHHRAVDSWWR